MSKIYLWFDDEIDSIANPLGAIINLLEKNHGLKIDKVSNLEVAENKFREGGFDLLFLDVRISQDKGGGSIDNKSWQRTGIALLKRIREGYYEPGTNRKIPIIVLTAVAAIDAQQEILSIGKGEDFKFALFEKPADDDEIARIAKSFLES